MAEQGITYVRGPSGALEEVKAPTAKAIITPPVEDPGPAEAPEEEERPLRRRARHLAEDDI